MALLKRETSRGFAMTNTNERTLSAAVGFVELFSIFVPAGRMNATKIAKLEMLAALTSGLVHPAISFKAVFGTPVTNGTTEIILGQNLGLNALGAADKPVRLELSVVPRETTGQNAYGTLQMPLVSTLLPTANQTFSAYALINSNYNLQTDLIVTVLVSFAAPETATKIVFKYANFEIS